MGGERRLKFKFMFEGPKNNLIIMRLSLDLSGN